MNSLFPDPKLEFRIHPSPNIRQNTRHRSIGDIKFKNTKSCSFLELISENSKGQLCLGSRGSLGATWPGIHTSLFFCQVLWEVGEYWFTQDESVRSQQRMPTVTHAHKSRQMPPESQRMGLSYS